ATGAPRRAARRLQGYPAMPPDRLHCRRSAGRDRTPRVPAPGPPRRRCRRRSRTMPGGHAGCSRSSSLRGGVSARAAAHVNEGQVWFDPCHRSGYALALRRGQVAQLVEHATENRGVDGSIPLLATSNSTTCACRCGGVAVIVRVFVRVCIRTRAAFGGEYDDVRRLGTLLD